MAIPTLTSKQDLHVCTVHLQPSEVLHNSETKSINTVASRSLDKLKEGSQALYIDSLRGFKCIGAAEALNLLENIKSNHGYDAGVVEACNELSDLCKKSGRFYLEYQRLISDQTITEELKENILFVLAGMSEETPALRTPEQLARRVLDRNIPLDSIKDGVLVDDVTKQESKGYIMPLEDFKKVLERVKKNREREVLQVAFQQQYVKPVEELFEKIPSKVQDFFNRVTAGSLLGGIGIVGMGFLIGKFIIQTNNH